MPGGKGNVESPGWFENAFGFREKSFAETRRCFEAHGDVLTSLVNGAHFHVGVFEHPSLADLRSRASASSAAATDLGRLTFRNISATARSLHLDANNAGAVFQVASQFNCLEMKEPGAKPEHGVTGYYNDQTQGPACALSCPAATVFRNYLVNNGQGQAGGGQQIDCLSAVAEHVQNSKEQYWRMLNGYCMPIFPRSVGKLSERIAGDATLADEVRSRVQVGVHWDTEVKGGGHRVCQVFCAAVPVAYTKATRSQEWAPFACAILDASYEATLAIATVLAAERGCRVKVYLTAVGGGAFGNRTAWILAAMEKAMKTFANSPLDVMLVHFASIPRSAYSSLESGRRPSKAGSLADALFVSGEPKVDADLPIAGDSFESGASRQGEVARPPSSATSSMLERIIQHCEEIDPNGDGVLNKGDFENILSQLDPTLSGGALTDIFEASDVAADGEVHYREFCTWIFAEASESAVCTNETVIGRHAGESSGVGDSASSNSSVDAASAVPIQPALQLASLREPSKAASEAGSSSGPRASTTKPPSPASSDSRPLVQPKAATKAAPKVPRGAGCPEGALGRIRASQERSGSYNRALREITKGRKTGHWIWYVWPTLAALRPGTSRPDCLLPDLTAAKAYLLDEVLHQRLEEITVVATEQLQRGVSSKVLFGTTGDADKFVECMTVFAAASVDTNDEASLQVFSKGLEAAQRGVLHTRAVEVLALRAKNVKELCHAAGGKSL